MDSLCGVRVVLECCLLILPGRLKSVGRSRCTDGPTFPEETWSLRGFHRLLKFRGTTHGPRVDYDG